MSASELADRWDATFREDDPYQPRITIAKNVPPTPLEAMMDAEGRYLAKRSLDQLDAALHRTINGPPG